MPRAKGTEILSWRKTCQKCRHRDKTTRSRMFRTKNFMGPCGDSFCYASCDSESCREISAVICDKCYEELKK